MTLLLTSWIGTQAQATPIDINFEKLKDLLQSRNARVQSSALEYEAAQEREGSLGRSFLPKVDAYGNHETFVVGDMGRRTQPSYGAEVKVNLFKGGRDEIESDVRTLTAERRSFQVQRTVAEELMESRRLYWEIVFNQDQVELIQLGIKINDQNLAAAEKRIRSGVATETDRVEFEMKAVMLRRDLAQAEMRLGNFKRDFSLLMNFRANEELRFPTKIDHTHDFDDLLASSPRDRIFLSKEEELRGKEVELLAKSQKRVWWPELEAFAAYNQYNQRIDSAGFDIPSNMRNESVVGLRAKLSFGDGFEAIRESAALSKEAMANLKRAEFRRHQVETHLQNEISELRYLHDQVHDADTNIARAERYYKLTQSEYGRGVKNSPDVLGASEKLFENRLKRLEIIKAFQMVRAQVMAKIGK